MAAAPALLVHGAGGGGWEWNAWAAVLAADGFDVHAPDLVPAAAGLAATRFADYLDQLEQAAGAFAAPPLLVGASLGGLLALALSTRVPAAALALVNPLPPSPLHVRLPPREPWPAIVPWGREASLAGTRRALPDADDATCLYAFRRWRDESGAVLEQARAGITLELPPVPILMVASGNDQDVPTDVSVQLAEQLGAEVELLGEASHVGPLLGSDAALVAARVVGWFRELRR